MKFLPPARRSSPMMAEIEQPLAPTSDLMRSYVRLAVSSMIFHEGRGVVRKPRRKEQLMPFPIRLDDSLSTWTTKDTEMMGLSYIERIKLLDDTLNPLKNIERLVKNEKISLVGSVSPDQLRSEVNRMYEEWFQGNFKMRSVDLSKVSPAKRTLLADIYSHQIPCVVDFAKHLPIIKADPTGTLTPGFFDHAYYVGRNIFTPAIVEQIDENAPQTGVHIITPFLYAANLLSDPSAYKMAKKRRFYGRLFHANEFLMHRRNQQSILTVGVKPIAREECVEFGIMHHVFHSEYALDAIIKTAQVMHEYIPAFKLDMLLDGITHNAGKLGVGKRTEEVLRRCQKDQYLHGDSVPRWHSPVPDDQEKLSAWDVTQFTPQDREALKMLAAYSRAQENYEQKVIWPLAKPRVPARQVDDHRNEGILYMHDQHLEGMERLLNSYRYAGLFTFIADRFGSEIAELTGLAGFGGVVDRVRRYTGGE